jgi:hypothetical protein
MPRKNGIESLSQQKKQKIIDLYESTRPRKEIQLELAEYLGVKERMVRYYAKQLGLNVSFENVPDDEILVYDIETSRVEVSTWWTGKQYINHKQLRNEPKIISISWKWIGEDEVHSLTWDKNHCDKKMMTKFLKEYNKASMVIGQNNNSFDNKWINGLYGSLFRFNS